MADELFSVDRAVWTAMQSQRTMTLDELQMLIGRDSGECVDYLNVLLRNKYAAVVGIRRAGSGEAVPLFKLTRATGPDAPYGDADDMFCDPNLASAPARPRRKADRKPLGDLPSMQGRIRWAAERIGRPFEREEIVKATGKSGTDFNKGWHRLVWNKDLVEVGNDRHKPLWEIRINPVVPIIKAWLLSHPGKAADFPTLRAAGIEFGNGPFVRIAADMLAADGYPVIVEDRDRHAKRYRVMPKEEA